MFLSLHVMLHVQILEEGPALGSAALKLLDESILVQCPKWKGLLHGAAKKRQQQPQEQ